MAVSQQAIFELEDGVLSDTPAMPASHELKAVGEWYLQRLGVDKDQLRQKAASLCKTGGTLRVGTMCSGTDSPVAVMKALQEVMDNKIDIEHTFSCEFDPKKQQWIKDNFPSLELLFGDITELQTGKATNYKTNKVVDVPPVDIVVAGFVCKSVSLENNEREKYSNCIMQSTGATGITFDGMMGYVKRYHPSLVICENVKGLTTRNKGQEPVVMDVKRVFGKAGYAFDYKVLDSRDYLLPQRRNRCWMFAYDGRENLAAAQQTGDKVVSLASTQNFGFDKLFRAAEVATAPDAKLNPRQKRVVAAGLKKLRPAERKNDVVVDVAKSEERAPVCVGAAPCIVPNSIPYRTQTKQVLTPEQVHACQGIYPADFPALRKYSQEKAGLTRDLAGNAFSTTVCMAVVISAFIHAPSKAKEDMRSPTRVSKRRATSLTPPRPSKARKVSSPTKTHK